MILTASISIFIIALYLYALVIITRNLSFSIHYKNYKLLVKNILLIVIIFIFYIFTVVLTLQNNTTAVIVILAITLLSITLTIIPQKRR